MTYSIYQSLNNLPEFNFIVDTYYDLYFTFYDEYSAPLNIAGGSLKFREYGWATRYGGNVVMTGSISYPSANVMYAHIKLNRIGKYSYYVTGNTASKTYRVGQGIALVTSAIPTS